MVMVKISQVKVSDSAGQPVPLRESVVESVVAGLRAAQLSHEEMLAVVAAIHATLVTIQVEAGKSAVAVTTTVVDEAMRASALTVIREHEVPYLVQRTVNQLVTECSPELWGEMDLVMMLSEEEFAEYELVLRS